MAALAALAAPLLAAVHGACGSGNTLALVLLPHPLANLSPLGRLTDGLVFVYLALFSLVWLHSAVRFAADLAPTAALARVVRDVVIPRPELRGLYHVGADPIGKYELLKLIAKAYGKQIEIFRDNEFSIDRSLNSWRFNQATGYKAAAWPDLIQAMHASR